MLVCIALVPLSSRGASPQSPPQNLKSKQPLSFVPNLGQTDSRVRYYAQAPGFGAYFTKRGVTLDVHKGSHAAALELRFPGASVNSTLSAERRAPGKVNYFAGRHRYTNLQTYTGIRYRDLWPGIDLAFRAEGGKLKYEFLLRPGADAASIRLAYVGADSVAVDGKGTLVVATAAGPLRDSRPVTRQGGNPVASHYVLDGRSFGFALGAYDRARPLVIDPGLVYSTFLGGSDGTGNPGDDPKAIAVDSGGSAYVVGDTSSPDFPTTPGAYNTTLDPNSPFTVFVSKFNPNGTGLVYSTFLGGSGGDEAGGVAVDGAGNAYIVGDTSSPDFPTTAGTDRTLDGPSDTFIAKLGPSGSSLVYSTLLGGNDLEYGNGIAVDASGSAYITGYTSSDSFPVSAGAPDTSRGAQGDQDSFVTKLSTNGRVRQYSTYLGGSGQETAGGIAVDGSGNAYVAGFTQSSDFPTTAGALDQTLTGYEDAYVTKLNSTGTALAYSTLVGGSGLEEAYGIAVDSSGNAYASGNTTSEDFPTTPGAYDRSLGGIYDAFVTKLSASGSSLVYSTFVGSDAVWPDQGTDAGRGIALDSSGDAYVVGSTSSRYFPTTDGTYDATFGGGFSDAVLFRLSSSGAGLTYSTYLGGGGDDYVGTGGIAVDGASNAYVAGSTGSSDYPVTPGAYKVTLSGAADGFVTKLDPSPFGYPRPRGATPTQVALVPAYRQCRTPGDTHGAPLAFGSCAPPQPASDYLTVGTPDANGYRASLIGFVRYKVIRGNIPQNDQADVEITVSLQDVRKRSDLSAYNGELRLSNLVRLTDRQNGSGGNDPATVQDFDFPVSLPCFPTVAGYGSTCGIRTTANAILPGSVTDFHRAIWALDQVRVYDGGADGSAGTTGDNTLFLTQGIFTP